MLRTLLMGTRAPSVPYLGCLFVWLKLGCQEKDLAKLKRVFAKADRDGSGQLNLLEFLMYVDVEKTPLAKRVFSLFDYDGSEQMSFKEFTFALWNFASLDHPGLGRFTFGIYARDAASIDAKGIRAFIVDVYGEDGVSGPMAKRVDAELQALRRSEGGRIGAPAWESFVARAQSSLGPLFALHRTLQKKCLGLNYWERITARRSQLFGKLPWETISKNMKALDLAADNGSIASHESAFFEMVKDAYSVFERNGSLYETQVDQAIEFLEKNVLRGTGSRGDESPSYVDVHLVKEELDDLTQRKIREKRRDNKVSDLEWEGAFQRLNQSPVDGRPGISSNSSVSLKSNSFFAILGPIVLALRVLND